MSQPGFSRDRRGRKVAAPTLLLLAWTAFIVYGTMLPFDFRANLDAATARLRDVPDLLGRSSSRSDVVSNVLLFLPWGGLFAFRAKGRGSGFVVTWLGATAGGLALSVAVEAAQLFLPSRTTSPIDLATNALGSSLGALIGWTLARRLWPTWSPRLEHFASRRPLAACALAAGVGLVVAGLSPFDVSLELSDLKGSIKAARPVPFGPSLDGQTPPAKPWSWTREALNWSLAGGLVVLALREAGSRGPRAILTAVALCGGLSAAIEAAQLAIHGRTADATSIFFAVIGATIGALAVGSVPRRDARRWIGPALVIWASTVTLASWTPPRLAPSWQWPHWSQLVPFWSYYRRTDLYAMADLVDQVIGFVPLGVLLAARGVRRPLRRSLLIGFGLGIVLEVGQLNLADRTAEITDALSAAAGATLGAWLWGWSTRSRA